MRKELLWAGIIGIIFGLVIGFGVWRVKTSMVNEKGGKPTPSPLVNSEDQKIAINKPENFDVITQSPIIISGLTKPKTWVVVSTEENDYLNLSSDEGIFEVNTELLPGVNNIVVTSVGEGGVTASEKLIIVYSSSFQTNTPSPTPNSTESGATKDFVAQKLARAQNQPKAYMGTVTDIADSTIQIKNADSQIQQIATDKYDVAVVNSKSTSTKTVKLTDVAIGDYIIAMGYVDGNEVLDAGRIVISNPVENQKISVGMYNVEEVGKKTLTLKPPAAGDILTITPDKNVLLASYVDGKTKSISLANIPTQGLVIMVSDDTGTPSLRRAIFSLGQE